MFNPNDKKNNSSQSCLQKLGLLGSVGEDGSKNILLLKDAIPLTMNFGHFYNDIENGLVITP